MTEKPRTALSRYTTDAIRYRDQDLVRDLLGKASFTEAMFRQVMGRAPTPEQLAVVDAILVVLMEHGLTPSAISARLVYMSSPENLQAGVAAGLLAVGSQFVGTMEDCARLLDEALSAEDGVEAAADRIALRRRESGTPVPGFGHHLHKPDDPRAAALLELAEANGAAGGHVRALKTLAAAVDAARGKHVTINATGAAAAVMGDVGVPVRVMRGFAVVSRAAGLVAHIAEEQERPAGRFIWDLVDRAVPFSDVTGDEGAEPRP